MPEWDSSQYLKFENERTQPCRDLAARVRMDAPASVMDLGCGPGNSTEVIAARFPGAAMTGLDSSGAMIATARANHPDWRWVTGDIAEWAAGGECYDLVFSNAALQWVGDHARVMPQLLRRGKTVAAQMPANWNAAPHRLMREVADRFGILENVREWYTHDENFYYDALAPHCSRVDLWVTEYLHVMADADAIVEWYRGTGLRPFLEALPDAESRDGFVAAYRELIRAEFAPRADGRVVFPFRRVFFVAYGG
jgi:trans-aconitate 2-methyltransferase